MHINDLSLTGDAQVVLGILFSCINSLTFLSDMDNIFFFLPIFFGGF